MTNAEYCKTEFNPNQHRPLSICNERTTMKIKINKQNCVGHARCNAVAPELYTLDEETGYTDIDEKEVPPELEALARRGARACPEGIITIIEE